MTVALFDNQKNLLINLRQELKMHGFAQQLENQYENLPLYSKMTFEDRVTACVDAEISARKEKLCASRIKNAKFKDSLKLSDLTQTKEYGLSDEVFASLNSLQWINKACNIVISGASGVGKTGLACALGYLCCSNGLTVRNYRTSDLLLEISSKRSDEKIRFLKNINRFNILILDDFGIAPITQEETQYLFNIIDDRYKNQPTIICTQLKAAGFPIFLGNDTKAEALTDRILHPSIHVELKGPSRRK